jgi:hypothetical protein
MRTHELHLWLKPHVILERSADSDDVVLIDAHSGRMNACNETASVILSQLEAGSTLTDLVGTLMRHFAVGDSIAIRDVNAFLDLLSAEGLLEATERDATVRRTRNA